MCISAEFIAHLIVLAHDHIVCVKQIRLLFLGHIVSTVQWFFFGTNIIGIIVIFCNMQSIIEKFDSAPHWSWPKCTLINVVFIVVVQIIVADIAALLIGGIGGTVQLLLHRYRLYRITVEHRVYVLLQYGGS